METEAINYIKTKYMKQSILRYYLNKHVYLIIYLLCKGRSQSSVVFKLLKDHDKES